MPHFSRRLRTSNVVRRLATDVKPHRGFDPRRVGNLETVAWATYYRREWIPFLRAAVGLTRHTFGLPWSATLRGAWLVLRANQLWAPFPDNDPVRARQAMERFYRLVAEFHGEPVDPRRASELEVEWWRVHCEHQHSDELDESSLIAALAALYSYTYGVEPEAVTLAAEQRALAMRYSDQWVEGGRRLDDPLLEDERAALVRSYAALLAAVHRR